MFVEVCNHGEIPVLNARFCWDVGICHAICLVRPSIDGSSIDVELDLLEDVKPDLEWEMHGCWRDMMCSEAELSCALCGSFIVFCRLRPRE